MKKISYKILILMLVLLLGLTSCKEDNEHVHEEVIDDAVKATCTETGLAMGMHCSTCNQVLVAQEVVPATGHTFGEWYEKSSSEEQHDCVNCSYSETREIAAHTHEYGNWVVTKEATCNEAGSETRTCKECSNSETRTIPSLGHDEIEHEGKNATCTESGYKAYVTCSRCDYTTYEEIESLGHVFGSWYATSSVKERRDCVNCSHFETKDVENTETHTHNYGEWYVLNDPTCDATGVERRDCSGCANFETRTIAALGHNKTSHAGRDATCTEAGYQAYETCSKCSWTTYKEISAKGHSYGAWYVSVPATQTSNGTEKRECINCDHFETKSIPATGSGSTTDTSALLQADLDAISLPSTLSASYKYTNTGANGTKFTYLSSNAGVLDDEGNVTRMLYDVDVTVRVIGTLNGVEKEKQVTIKVLKYELPEKTHQIILEASDFPVPDNSTTFKKGNGYIELNSTKVNNYFYCGEGEEYIAPKPFTGLVVSWGAIDTSSTAKVTVEIKLRVNGTWSDYVSYGAWGFEGTNGNASKTDSTGLIKISTDEISVLNGKTADAIRYKVNLSRSSASAVSPKIKYLSFAFDYSSYSYPVNRNHLPESVFYNVPKRYQLDVAGDGNVMCSATSTTMMLEYHGINLTSKASAYGYIYPQEYIARKVVRDVNMSGGGFGNWVYNTVSMSHYGFKSYVARYYSIEELMYDLTKGPVCLSIKKCTMTQYENYKTYTHSGHIIVAVGYKYINGQLYITCNDPYVSQVTCNYSADLIKTYWKYIGYVIE